METREVLSRIIGLFTAEELKALGKEMDILGRKMHEASARAETAMGTLLERAIASGLAQPVK